MRRGVGASAQVSFRTVDGRRLELDLVLRNGARYAVEMNLGAETKLLDAMVQLYEYGKHITQRSRRHRWLSKDFTLGFQGKKVLAI